MLNKWFKYEKRIKTSLNANEMNKKLSSIIHIVDKPLLINNMNFKSISEKFIGHLKENKYEFYLKTSYKASTKAIINASMNEDGELDVKWSIHSISSVLIRIVFIMLVCFNMIIFAHGLLNEVSNASIPMLLILLLDLMYYISLKVFKKIFDKEVDESFKILESHLSKSFK